MMKLPQEKCDLNINLVKDLSLACILFAVPNIIKNKSWLMIFPAVTFRKVVATPLN